MRQNRSITLAISVFMGLAFSAQGWASFIDTFPSGGLTDRSFDSSNIREGRHLRVQVLKPGVPANWSITVSHLIETREQAKLLGSTPSLAGYDDERDVPFDAAGLSICDHAISWFDKGTPLVFKESLSPATAWPEVSTETWEADTIDPPVHRDMTGDLEWDNKTAQVSSTLLVAADPAVDLIRLQHP